jgi:uncharacterized protein YjiS (DUF1127 family)
MLPKRQSSSSPSLFVYQRTPSLTTSAWGSLSDAARRAGRREREIKKAVAALAKLDDRTLRDIGIPQRSQIEQVVRYCRDCRCGQLCNRRNRLHSCSGSLVRPQGFLTQHERCYDARLPQSSAALALRFALSTGCLRQATKVHSARTRVEGLMRSRLLPRPDRQGAQAPPASQRTRGQEANDSRHRTS